MTTSTNRKTTSLVELTVSPVLQGVLALKKLASGVVAFTDPTGIQGGLGAQETVTTHSLKRAFRSIIQASGSNIH